MSLTTARTRDLRKNWKVATIKEIRDRINSVNDTRKITNAMYLISSTKLRRAKKMLTDTEPFFFSTQAMISRLVRHLPDGVDNIFLETRLEIPEDERRRLRRSRFFLRSRTSNLRHSVFLMKLKRRLMKIMLYVLQNICTSFPIHSSL